MESIESLPYYMSLAQGASPPKGRQMTIRWYAHLSRDALVMDVGGQVFHLLRVQKPELPHLNVIGELREADAALGGLEKIVSDDGSANTDAADALPTDTEWLALPVFADIVVHLDTKTFHVRYSDEWNMLSSDQKEKEEHLDKRNSTLHGVPSPVVSFCLGADALLAMHKFSKVLRVVAKLGDLPFESRSQAIGILKQKLSNAAIESSLMGSAEWDIPDNDWASPRNTLSFAFARIAHSDARWISLKRRVVVYGVEGPKEKMFYLGVTELGAMNDESVTFYNEGTRNALAGKKVATERAEYSRDFLQQNWPLFSSPPLGPVMFPADPESRMRYVLALTRFAQQRSADPALSGQMHNKGCVCQWITEDVTQLVCGWCGQDKYNGQKQFCDHVNGQKHQKKCEAAATALTHEALNVAVSTVHEASLRQEGARSAGAAGEGVQGSVDRWQGGGGPAHASSASGASYDGSSQWSHGGGRRAAGEEAAPPSGPASATNEARPWKEYRAGWGEEAAASASATHHAKNQWGDNKRWGWCDRRWDNERGWWWR